MPHLSEITYSREGTIAAVRDYYQFLTKLYLPESSVLEPPPSGWPNITSESLRPLGKTEEVVALLRHLPYISRAGGLQLQGAPHCYFADHHATQFSFLSENEENVRDFKLVTEGLDYGSVPAHVVGLTSGGRDNPLFLLDTALGIVHWVECPDGPMHQPSREKVLDQADTYAPENEEGWRSNAPAWAISDFFEVLKDEFRSLNFLPTNEKDVMDTYTTYGDDEESGLIPMVQRIYREHRWPDLDTYRKDECLTALRRALRENYPDYASDSESEE
jgi:hypothetical protein